MHFCMIKCIYDVISLSIFVIYDVQYVAITCVKNKLDICICKPQMSNTYIKCISFYV